jgi:exodeoxyribonuclease VII large subunit
MAEAYDDRKIFSLLDVTRSIQRTLADRYSSAFWVKAEMNKLNHYSHSGHCYPDLVEKKDGKVIAQLRSSLWKDDFRRVNQRFLNVLKEPLKDGINILFQASIQFDPIHGLSLRIIDIDPVFSLGELEREKQESIVKLNEEGIFNLNKSTKLPLLPQRIAVISVETSKGYADYLKVIDKNPWGYKFFNVLFPSLLQGEKSVGSILAQLNRIKKIVKHFDAVAIIRGGGGDVGLSSYNNYQLAKEVAKFPIPVITGIGHSTNETVVEMVAYKNAITPTELADFLLQKFHDFSVPVRRAEEIIVERAQRLIQDEKTKLQHTMRYFQSMTHNRLLINKHALEGYTKSLIQQSKFRLAKEVGKLEDTLRQLSKMSREELTQRREDVSGSQSELLSVIQIFIEQKRLSLQHAERNVQILDPVNILKRGFSITLNSTGRAVTDASELKQGESVITRLAHGTIESTVNTIKESDDER